MFDKLFVQRRFADFLAPRVQGFRVQSYSPYRANFRCPICGDSQTNKFKKRGYIIENSGGFLVYHCHNQCGAMGFESFLRDHYDDLYTEYKIELLDNLKQPTKSKVAEEIVYLSDTIDTEIDLPSVATNREATKYLMSRQIPQKFWDDIFYTDKYYAFINRKVEDKFPESFNDMEDSRIVFPLRDFDGQVFGVIGRSLDNSNRNRYLTIKFDESKPKLFGLDRANLNSIIYVVEGPIDSLFIDNCVAMAGTDGGNPDTIAEKDDLVIILDNQPRSPSVINKYQKYITDGYPMVIWPNRIEHKDINDMILAGITEQQLKTIIVNNTFSGVKLKIMFNNWRKV